MGMVRDTKAHMRTPAGILKAPPYTIPGQKVIKKAPQDADIIDHPFQPYEARMSEANIGWNKSDRELEKILDRWMHLNGDAKRACEEAKIKGEIVFTQVFGSHENIIEVFFNINLDSLGKDKHPAAGSLDEVEKLGSSYLEINLSPGAIYVALDCQFRRIFVYFSNGFELVYGPTVGKWVVDSTTYNIEEYAEIQPPQMPKDQQHLDYKNWLLSNPHLCWAPWSRAGVLHWGSWLERGHPEKGTCITKDTTKIPVHVQPVLTKLFRTLGNVTRAKRILLGAIDVESRDLCQKIIKEYPEDKKRFWITDEKECFALRACLVNVFTEPHYDGGDLNDGWAMMAPMGAYCGGNLCITELQRQFVYQPGGIGAIRGAKLQHYTLRWDGFRYCLVSTIHESLRKEYLANIVNK